MTVTPNPVPPPPRSVLPVPPPLARAPVDCCEVGSYEHTVPMPIAGRRRDIDFCIADLVAALNAAGIATIASCCGHRGKCPADILLEDGRVLTIANAKRDGRKAWNE